MTTSPELSLHVEMAPIGSSNEILIVMLWLLTTTQVFTFKFLGPLKLN